MEAEALAGAAAALEAEEVAVSAAADSAAVLPGEAVSAAAYQAAAGVGRISGLLYPGRIMFTGRGTSMSVLFGDGAAEAGVPGARAGGAVAWAAAEWRFLWFV